MSKIASNPVWITIPLNSYVTKCYKVAINVRELTALTNNFSLKYVNGCTPNLLKSYPKELSMQYRVMCQKVDSDPSGHEVRIKFDVGAITSTTKLNDLAVKVSCSCPAFLYWGAQWNLHNQDALEGQPRPMLQAPTEQLDKRNGYMICKHVKVVADRILPSVSRVINNVAQRLRVDEYKKKQEEEARSLQEEVDQEFQTPTEEFRIEDDETPEEWFLKEKRPEPKKKSPLPYTPEPTKPQPKKKNRQIEFEIPKGRSGIIR